MSNQFSIGPIAVMIKVFHVMKISHVESVAGMQLPYFRGKYHCYPVCASVNQSAMAMASVFHGFTTLRVLTVLLLQIIVTSVAAQFTIRMRIEVKTI